MKIYIDGGKRAAINRMFYSWNKMGHSIVDSFKKADVQLSIIKIKTKKGLPTVLRLDGIYYDRADNFKQKNSVISSSHKIANAIIYQSNYSKQMCEKYLDKRNTKIIDIIYNGIDNWNNFLKHNNINIVSCSKWRRHKRLPEIVDIFTTFQKIFPNSILHIIGPMDKGCNKINYTNIIYYDRLDENSIKEIYRTCDIYLHLSKKDSCPSTVVEAISAGIPVITTNACGGATEMSNLTKNCFIIPGDIDNLEPDYIYEDEYNKISNKLKNDFIECMKNIYKNKLRVKLPPELKIEYVAKKYIDIMEKII
jgi:glycosyltransferase involved in cell wall biosynthesis